MESLHWSYCVADGTCDYTVTPLDTIPSNLDPAVVISADSRSWALLFDVLEDPPESVVQQLDSMALVRLWVEGPGLFDAWRCLYLRFSDGSVSVTLRVRGYVVPSGHVLWRHTRVF